MTEYINYHCRVTDAHLAYEMTEESANDTAGRIIKMEGENKKFDGRKSLQLQALVAYLDVCQEDIEDLENTLLEIKKSGCNFCRKCKVSLSLQ